MAIVVPRQEFSCRLLAAHKGRTEQREARTAVPTVGAAPGAGHGCGLTTQAGL